MEYSSEDSINIEYSSENSYLTQLLKT